MRKKILVAREISWLSFNARVLQEADNPNVPLKERIRFLGIFSNNRDEFFRIRMAALKKVIPVISKKNKFKIYKKPKKLFNQINSLVLKQQVTFNRIWKNIIADLKKENVFLLNDKHLNAKQKIFVRNFFDQMVSSSINPFFIENLPQLPYFKDDNIFLGIIMKKNGSKETQFAIIEIPTQNLNRFVALPSPAGVQNFILLEDIIHFNLPTIFSHLGYNSFEAHMFKVTKDAEIDIDNDLSTPIIQKIEKGVKNRRKAPAVRFLYDSKMNPKLLKLLIRKLSLTSRDSIIPGGYIRNFRDFMDFPAVLPNKSIRPAPFQHPALTKSQRVSDVILKRDVLLHLPYHSFNSVIDLLREAAMDPDVKTIKITAYRLATNSKICNALINAVHNGKEVHVVLELRASLDEEANLQWKTKLEEEGVKVFVGIPNLKVHAKICVVTKQLDERMVHYGFIGTGNLNEKKALTYTDHFLLTSHHDIMADIEHIFKVLENPKLNWKRRLGFCKVLLVSPTNMRGALSSKINSAIKTAKGGKPAKIIVNLNSLSDEKLIKKLYNAASAGVQISLIVRGIFCVATDKKRFVTPIKAISIIDEYLEHGRIWLFHNKGKEEVYISSADWMPRNMDYRIEVAVPILDKALKEELKHILDIKLSDNVKARWLDRKLSNQYVTSTKKKVRSQIAIYRYLKRKR